MMMKVANNLSL